MDEGIVSDSRGIRVHDILFNMDVVLKIENKRDVGYKDVTRRGKVIGIHIIVLD